MRLPYVSLIPSAYTTSPFTSWSFSEADPRDVCRCLSTLNSSWQEGEGEGEGEEAEEARKHRQSGQKISPIPKNGMSKKTTTITTTKRKRELPSLRLCIPWSPPPPYTLTRDFRRVAYRAWSPSREDQQPVLVVDARARQGSGGVILPELERSEAGDVFRGRRDQTACKRWVVGQGKNTRNVAVALLPPGTGFICTTPCKQLGVPFRLQESSRGVCMYRFLKNDRRKRGESLTRTGYRLGETEVKQKLQLKQWERLH